MMSVYQGVHNVSLLARSELVPLMTHLRMCHISKITTDKARVLKEPVVITIVSESMTAERTLRVLKKPVTSARVLKEPATSARASESLARTFS